MTEGGRNIKEKVTQSGAAAAELSGAAASRSSAPDLRGRPWRRRSRTDGGSTRRVGSAAGRLVERRPRRSVLGLVVLCLDCNSASKRPFGSCSLARLNNSWQHSSSCSSRSWLTWAP